MYLYIYIFFTSRDYIFDVILIKSNTQLFLVRNPWIFFFINCFNLFHFKNDRVSGPFCFWVNKKYYYNFFFFFFVTYQKNLLTAGNMNWLDFVYTLNAIWKFGREKNTRTPLNLWQNASEGCWRPEKRVIRASGRHRCARRPFMPAPALAPSLLAQTPLPACTHIEQKQNKNKN